MKDLLLVFAVCFGLCSLNAQERYADEIFDQVQVTTLVYSDSTGYLMDVYEPVGDTLSQRPLLVLAHGGAFYAGTKNNGTMVDMCTSFAKRGYVAASIQYELAPNIVALLDSLVIMETVIQAMGDGKAAIRYFRQDAATDDQFRIDPERVFMGGNSAGAILSMHLGYLDDLEVVPEHLLDIVERNGGLEGNRGNFGYDADVLAIVNLAGGLNSTIYVDEQSPPTVSVHGDEDSIVPFDCNSVYWGTELLPGIQLDLADICGSSTIHPLLDNFEIDNALWVLEGEDHTPWSLGNSELQNEVIEYVSDFLFDYARGPQEPPVSTLDVEALGLSIYPNPATDRVVVDCADCTSDFQLSLFATDGRAVAHQVLNNSSITQIDLSNHNNGVYFYVLTNTATGELAGQGHLVVQRN